MPVQDVPQIEQLLLGVSNCGRNYVANDQGVSPYV